MSHYATKSAEPCAYITTQKQRVKQNGENVYLKNNTEFELELFNPLQTTILAKIKLNGNYISSNGLVLKPGQRVFLERYLNEARKFKFETYEVDGRSSEVREAIQNNGSVEVEFYLEYVQPISNPIWITSNNYPYYSGGLNTFTTSSSNINTYYSNTSLNIGGSNSLGTLSLGNSSDIKSISKTPQIKSSLRSRSLKKMETGTVEKGGNSNQSFTTIDKTFNTFYTYKSTWKILPFSQKNIEIDEIKRYCPGCGTKVKKTSHKYCYNCGTKL
jgi:hypothetical protein